MSPAREVSAKKLRRQLFIAPRAQGRMMYRAMIQVVSTATGTALLSLVLHGVAEMTPTSAMITALAITLVVAIPASLVDAARISNEVLGPFVRVQGAVRQIAHGDEISKIKIRDDDMWQEWMQEFNVMIDRIQPLNLQYRPVNDLSSDVASGQEVT